MVNNSLIIRDARQCTRGESRGVSSRTCDKRAACDALCFHCPLIQLWHRWQKPRAIVYPRREREIPRLSSHLLRSTRGRYCASNARTIACIARLISRQGRAKDSSSCPRLYNLGVFSLVRGYIFRRALSFSHPPNARSIYLRAVHARSVPMSLEKISGRLRQWFPWELIQEQRPESGPIRAIYVS